MSARIELVSEAPVLRASEFGDYGATLAAGYFIDGDTHHAYVVAFGQLPGDQRVFHVTSADGITWTIDTADPFAELGLDLSPPGPIPGTVLELDDGSWVMYLWGDPTEEIDGAVLWRATATAPGGPWTANPEPIIELGDQGAWDDLALDFPSVVATSDGFAMLYSAVGAANRSTSSIGLATSVDGEAWTRLPEPVIGPALCGKENARYASMPRLLSTDGGYVVLYETERETAAARSTDLRTWTCAADGSLLTARDVPGGLGIHSFALAQDGSGIFDLVESLIEGGSELWLAEVIGLN